MNVRISKMQAQLSKLDQYTQLAVLGSWAYIVNTACINQGMRYVPDEPVDNGIETFTQYEAARRQLINQAETSQLPGLLNLQRDLHTWIEGAGGQTRDLADTLQFMSGNVPSRKQFEAEYENRRRMGMQPRMTIKQFVDAEYGLAVERHAKLVNRGDDAVRLCETFTLEELESDAPDWLIEAFESKLIEKLHARWEKLELTRSNPRRSKQIRDSATADQLMIAHVLAEYGEEPGFDEAPVQAAEPFESAAGDLTSIVG